MVILRGGGFRGERIAERIRRGDLRTIVAEFGTIFAASNRGSVLESVEMVCCGGG